DRSLPAFYNVNFAVGAPREFLDLNSPATDPSVGYIATKRVPVRNQRDDVMLVQYLLKKIHRFAPGMLAPEGDMTVDGICGPITRRWIGAFQRELRIKRKKRIATDGIVDRALGVEGSISHTTYTILFMNLAFKANVPI